MSFSMPFFKRKSEQNLGRPLKPAAQNHIPHETPQKHTNGESITEGYKDGFPSNNSLRNQLGTKGPCIYIESSGLNEPEQEGGSKLLPRSSQLSKTLEQVLHDKDALPYFIQFMDSVGSGDLVKFWLDVDTFKATLITRITVDPVSAEAATTIPSSVVSSDDPNVLLSSNLQTVDINHVVVSSTDAIPNAGKRSQPSSVTAHGHGQLSPSSAAGGPTSEPRLACESASLIASGRSESKSGRRDIPGGDSTESTGDVRRDSTGEQRFEKSKAIQSSSDAAYVLPSDAPRKDETKSSTSNLSGPPYLANSAEQHDCVEDEVDFRKTMKKSVENDAIAIFSKYLSPDCSHPIGISDELRIQTVGRICREDGVIDPRCFDDCQQYVFSLVEMQYYSEFLQSVYYIRHQIDILSQLLLSDILYNDTALSYFTEFMEEVGARTVLQCFLDLDNFQHHLLLQGDKYDGNEAQNDAMIIYDKYISMQATQPVRFDDNVRLRVESDICRESGPLPDCFQLPCQLVRRHMELLYFPQFMKSEVYTKYVTDLLNTSHLLQDSVEYKRKRTGSDASSEKSFGSQSVGSESLSSRNTYLARDTSRQNFAKAMNKFSDNLRIDGTLFNPDSLWHRPNAGRMKFGKVTELGKFVSDFDPDPDHDKKKHTPFFTVAKRREKEKSEEEMAWQVAQKIINDVMSVTSDDCFLPDTETSHKNS